MRPYENYPPPYTNPYAPKPVNNTRTLLLVWLFRKLFGKKK